MALRSALEILCLPDTRLRVPAQLARVPDAEIDNLIVDLVAAMRSASGLGLAAPQVGRDLRLAVVEADGRRLVLINPEITRRRGQQRGWEGCLSVPNFVALVDRPAELTVTGFDQAGRPVQHRCAGLLARAVAHEVDHLAGRLYIDLVPPDSLVDVREHPTPPGDHKNPTASTTAEVAR